MSGRQTFIRLFFALAILLTMRVQPSLAGKQPPPQQKESSNQSVLERYDLDGDGQITLTEFPDTPERFDQLDLNGDGALTSDELPTPKVPETMKEEQNRQGGPGKGGAPHGKGFEGDDVNKDGKVSKKEFSGPSDLFSKLDTNNDGYITKEEAEAQRNGGPGGRPPM
ncbi:EF-hand domain-containing protein [Desulfogranum japonicum]|uniref:EF-hand domain-containing protein n=1 Tax=Desulfogranum japonicum TaxID=231447 RepID=UPI00041A7828|nr:EF-hand domain-containing protein [Desulfogranum japonicum]